jgi:hypothetical protein
MDNDTEYKVQMEMENHYNIDCKVQNFAYTKTGTYSFMKVPMYFENTVKTANKNSVVDFYCENCFYCISIYNKDCIFDCARCGNKFDLCYDCQTICIKNMCPPDTGCNSEASVYFTSVVKFTKFRRNSL